MAQNKSTTRKTSKTKSAPAKKKTGRQQPLMPPEPVVPIRREIGGVFFLFLTLVIAISYFKNEGAFVQFFSDIVKGFAGWATGSRRPSFC